MEKVEEEEEEGVGGERKERRTLLILVQRLSDRIRFPAERQEFTVVRNVQNMSGVRGFGGLEVACWPLVPKFAGSNPAEAVGFFRAKKSSARLPSEGK